MLFRHHAVVFVLGGLANHVVAGGRLAGGIDWTVGPEWYDTLQASAADCNAWVECKDGYEVVDGERTETKCHEACTTLGGNCCTESTSCFQFTGSVCADGNQTSCAGEKACEQATIPIVVNSCDGASACEKAKIGSVVNSCKEVLSCWLAGAVGDRGSNGSITQIEDSCKGGRACNGMAQGGSVGPVIKSCNAPNACSYLANEGLIDSGTVGPMIESCNDLDACFKMGMDGGVIGPVAYSCNAFQACVCVSEPACYGAQNITFMNGSCNVEVDSTSTASAEVGCKNYAGDGSGLTCTANPRTSPITFSPDDDECFDTDGGIGLCDGSGPFCITAPSAMPSNAPSTSPSCPDLNEVYLPSNYWTPPLDKPGMACENVRLKIPDHGEFSCIPIGEGICRDNGGAFGEWRFGIEEVETPPCELSGECPVSMKPADTFPVLIDPANTRYPITGTTFTNSETGKVCENGYGEAIRGCNYAGTTHICISENIESDPNRYSDERPYMFFYDEKSHQYLYQLVCDGIGEEGKLPELKMVNNEDLADATYVKYPVDIVKFKKGATPNKDDANELWKMYMDWNGFEDPDTRRIVKLASFIGVAHPKFCKEYVSRTDKPCWKEDCNDGSVETPENYERVDCKPIP